MCGILTIAGKNIGKYDTQKVGAALQTLAHRGPDEQKEMRFENCILGQARLSIIDLGGGKQPMRDNTKNIAITFNGEIYNYKELKEGLEKKGHKFSTQSDTEVILKAYLEYGKECPKYLDGMFAFVIWDERRDESGSKREIFLARDRFGKKPLYYAFDTEGSIVIASEIKAIAATGIRPVLDPEGIDAYLTFMYLPPWRTVYKNIFPIPPAHSAHFGIDATEKISPVRYWALEQKPIDPKEVSYDAAKSHVKDLLVKAVEKRMLASDVEVGSFLSGGVDSTLVTAYAQKFVSHPIKTFSVGYDGAGEKNELPFAEAAAKKIGTDHHVLHASAENKDVLENAMAYFDEPHADSADLAQYILSEYTAKEVKVALAGDGGDELFLGYGWHTVFWNRPKLARLKNILTFATPYSEHLRLVGQFSPTERRRLMKENLSTKVDMEHFSRDFTGTGVEKINAFDITTYLPGQLLSKVDMMSMRHGLEVRCPLLDWELAEYAYNLPREYKMNTGTGKLILKDLLAEIMPREFVDRKKQGFGAPVRHWLSQPDMQKYVEKNLAPGAKIYTLLREEEVRKIIETAFRTKHPKQSYQTWILLCLELWLKSHEEFYEIA